MDQASSALTVMVDADTSSIRREFAEVSRLGSQFAATLSKAFVGLAIEGRSFGDVLRSLALGLSRMALSAAMRPLESILGGVFSSLLAGGGMAFAKGGIISQGLPVPFAGGGVIASPIAFPLAGGRAGIAGERGPEAIMPLARGPDGRLGVRAGGAGGVAVTFNVTTPDAESFRRSETQLAALLARAVGQGHRNL